MVFCIVPRALAPPVRERTERMSGIPHDLEAAHQRFKRWAGRALETFGGEHYIPDRDEGRAAIRLFLQVFCEIPGAKAELEHRARFVGKETAEGGRWAQAKKQAQPALRELGKRFSEGSVRYRTGALQGLAKQAPSFGVLKYIDAHCSGLLQEKIPQIERQLIENWHGETKRVVVSAERIGAEGARMLGNSKELESCFNIGTQGPNRLAEVRLAGVIEHVGPAVDSLVAWQRGQGRRGGRKGPKRKPGPKGPRYKEHEDRAIFNGWQTWRKNGGERSIEKYGREKHGVTGRKEIREIERAIAREQKRRRRKGQK